MNEPIPLGRNLKQEYESLKVLDVMTEEENSRWEEFMRIKKYSDECDQKMKSRSYYRGQLYYGWDSKPISYFEYFLLSSSPKHVAQTTIGNRFVSTVYIGLNLSYHQQNDPLIFETMVFTGEDESDPWHNYQDRYTHLKYAQMGHEDVVNRIMKGELPE